MSVLWKAGLQDPTSIPLGPFLSLIMSSARLWATVFVEAALFCIAGTLLADRSGRWDDLARAVLLLALAVGAIQISAMLVDTGDLRYRMEPGFFTFVHLPAYFVSAAVSVGLVTVTLVMQRSFRPAGAEDEVSLRVCSGKFAWGVPFVLVFAILMAAMSAKYTPQWLPSVAKAAAVQLNQYIIGHRNHPSLDRLAGHFNLADDRYILSRRNPINHPAMYLSLLKMKIRIARGDVGNITIAYVEDDRK
jgi:hypothetical protein